MTAKGPEFSITRVFDAPRDLVWKAFTERERLMQWWGPKGFTMLDAKLDLRSGGVFLYGVRSPCGANGSIVKSLRRSGWSQRDRRGAQYLRRRARFDEAGLHRNARPACRLPGEGLSERRTLIYGRTTAAGSTGFDYVGVA